VKHFCNEIETSHVRIYLSKIKLYKMTAYLTESRDGFINNHNCFNSNVFLSIGNFNYGVIINNSLKNNHHSINA